MKNQTGKYFKYAIGEILLVMIGILLALQVNNWNESRKQNVLKQKLIASLIEDFEYNKAALQFTKNIGDSLFNNMKTFYNLTRSEVPIVSVDSLRRLARSHFRGNTYNPNLTTYEEAKSAGNLSLLNNKSLSQQFAVFNRSYDAYSNLSDEGRFAFFNGGSWELRKTVDISLITTGQAIVDSSVEPIILPYNEYKAIIDMPLTKATLRNSYVLRRNIIGLFQTMDSTIDEILELLYNMKE